MRAGCVSFVAAWLVAAPAALAAPGDLDPSFSQDGKQTLGFGGEINRVFDATADEQGRTLVAGSTGTFVSSADDLAVARLTADGQLDPAFADAGVLRLDLGASELATSVETLPGGAAYVAINRQTQSNGEMLVLRLGQDGKPDQAFSGDGIASASLDSTTATATDLVPTPDGGVIVAGTAGQGDTQDIALARFGADGSLDPALGGDGTARSDLGGRESASAVEVDPAGRIVVGGISGVSEPLIARFLPSGDVDSSFSENGFADDFEVYAPRGFYEIAVLDDGRVVAGAKGEFGSFLFLRYSILYLRTFSESGELVASANVDRNALGGLAAQPGGGLAIAYTFDASGRGGFTPKDFVLDRLLASGEPDPDFGTGSRPGVQTDFARASDTPSAIAIAPDGRLIVAGTLGEPGASRADAGVARYLNAPGPRDPDADGVLGDADRCGASYGPPPDRFGCEELDRPITLTADPRRGPKKTFVLRGSIADSCFSDIRVRILRKLQGRDRLAGSDTTNQNGDYSVRGLSRAGRYYAEVKTEFIAFGICIKERSRALRVD